MSEQKLRELLDRVDRLESAQEIAQLHNEYVRNLAARNWDAVAEAYSDDAECDIRNHGVHRGREQIKEMFRNDLLEVVRSRDGYILSSPTISVDGDIATGTWTWHRFQADFRTALGWMRVWGPWSEGTYVTEYRRENAKWKISKLWFRVHAPDGDDELESFSVTNRSIGSGRLESRDATS